MFITAKRSTHTILHLEGKSNRQRPRVMRKVNMVEMIKKSKLWRPLKKLKKSNWRHPPGVHPVVRKEEIPVETIKIRYGRRPVERIKKTN